MSLVTDYFLNVPAGLNISNVKSAIEESYPKSNVEWAPFPMSGTHAVAGRAILHARLNRLLTKTQLDNLITAKGVNWTVLGIRSAYAIDPVIVNGEVTVYKNIVYYFVGKATILPALNDIQDGIDGNGDPIYRAPIISDTIYLSTYFGTDSITL